VWFGLYTELLGGRIYIQGLDLGAHFKSSWLIFGFYRLAALEAGRQLVRIEMPRDSNGHCCDDRHLPFLKGLAALLCRCYVTWSNLFGHGAYSGWSETVLHHWAQLGHIFAFVERTKSGFG
jgi:hypothetical protein